MSWFSGKWNFRLIRNENLPEGKYEGQVKDGKPHGQGIIHFAYDNEYHGETYEGTFKEGVIHGSGTMIWTGPFAGERYEGEHRDGEPNGQGTYYGASGNRYEGEFRDGLHHGQALIIRKPGMSIRGNGLTINQSVGGYLGQIVQGSG